MKKVIGFFALLGCLWACQKPRSAAPVVSSADFNKAETLYLRQQYDSAFYYFYQVTTRTGDSLEIAMAYNYMAAIQTDASDYYGAQESLTQSLTYLYEHKKEHRYCLASDYNELGMTSAKLHDYDNAITYFDAALRFSDDTSYRQVVLNNQANALGNTGAYPRAIAIYRNILANTEKNSKTYARVLTNLVSTRWRSDPAYRAAPELLSALALRVQLNDRWGQNSSYAHLADYYTGRKPDSALFYARQRLATARALGSPQDELDGLHKLMQIGPVRDAQQWFKQYDELNDSLQTVRNAAKNQFALIRYHSEKNKADNLKLQQDNSEKQRRFYGLLGAFVAVSVIAVAGYRQRKARLEKAKQEAASENQRKASKQVHDTLANDLYRLMKMVQNGTVPGQTWLVGNLNDVYQRARDLSYDLVSDGKNFEAKISALITSFATEEIRVLVVGNNAAFWENIALSVRIELKYILQELLVNMQKHSGATEVVIRFVKTNRGYRIAYTDDGGGIAAGKSFNNGLTNAETRMQSFGGRLKFDNHAGRGLQIDLFFLPV